MDALRKVSGRYDIADFDLSRLKPAIEYDVKLLRKILDCVKPITPEQASDIDPSKYAFVVLSDVPSVPSILEHSLERNVENGGSVLVATGMAESHREHIPVYGGNVEDGHFYARGASESEDAGFATAGAADASHPAMRDAKGFEGTKFFYAAVIDPGKARVVARLADGTIHQPNEGEQDCGRSQQNPGGFPVH